MRRFTFEIMLDDYSIVYYVIAIQKQNLFTKHTGQFLKQSYPNIKEVLTVNDSMVLASCFNNTQN